MDWRNLTAAIIQRSEDSLSSPLFFPLDRGEDYAGTQIGLISIPLIDDLQNQTVRGTVLFGWQVNLRMLTLPIQITDTVGHLNFQFLTSKIQCLDANKKNEMFVYWDRKAWGYPLLSQSDTLVGS